LLTLHTGPCKPLTPTLTPGPLIRSTLTPTLTPWPSDIRDTPPWPLIFQEQLTLHSPGPFGLHGHSGPLNTSPLHSPPGPLISGHLTPTLTLHSPPGPLISGTTPITPTLTPLTPWPSDIKGPLTTLTPTLTPGPLISGTHSPLHSPPGPLISGTHSPPGPLISGTHSPLHSPPGPLISGTHSPYTHPWPSDIRDTLTPYNSPPGPLISGPTLTPKALAL
ncbi:unnamed protein product, partial [Coregonus sp. 'balchen']